MRKIIYIFLILLILIGYSFFLGVKNNLLKDKVVEKECGRAVISDFSVSDPKFYQKAYEDWTMKDEKEKIYKKISGAIVNHHLLAGDYIAEILESLKKENPKTIILISPNHFVRGQGEVQTGNILWKSPLGEVSSSCEGVSLLKSLGVSEEKETFLGEHGVSNIIPFIAKSLPDVKVLPVIVKEGASPKFLDELAKSLSEIPNAVVVGSFDFSHELNPSLSEFMDNRSLDALKSFDFERVKSLAIDSRSGLYLLMKIMENKKSEVFKLFENTNSGYLIGKEINDATSYITGVFVDGKPVAPENLNLLFFGDLMLDRNVAKRMEIYGRDYIFENIEKLLSQNDILGANLEGVFSENQSISQIDNTKLRFTFDPHLATFLKEKHFDVLSQANNHSNDFGVEGRISSFDILEKAGIIHFGSYFNDEESFVSVEKENQKIAFIGFNEFSYNNYENVFFQIEKAKTQDNFVVVVAHWGVEYEKLSSEKQKEYARKFIDSGADLVIGAHPHVVEEVDFYKGKPIFYSIGNFVFDQDFSKETTEGLGLGVSINSQSIRIYLFPFNIQSSRIEFKEPFEREQFLKDLSSRSNTFLQPSILSGKIELSR